MVRRKLRCSHPANCQSLIFNFPRRICSESSRARSLKIRVPSCSADISNEKMLLGPTFTSPGCCCGVKSHVSGGAVSHSGPSAKLLSQICEGSWKLFKSVNPVLSPDKLPSFFTASVWLILATMMFSKLLRPEFDVEVP